MKVICRTCGEKKERKKKQYESMSFKHFLHARHCAKPLEGLFYIIFTKRIERVSVLVSILHMRDLRHRENFCLSHDHAFCKRRSQC